MSIVKKFFGVLGGVIVMMAVDGLSGIVQQADDRSDKKKIKI
jgi:hypothetical protein